MTSSGFGFNSSYRNIINYRDNLAIISQNIVIMFFWLSHRPRAFVPKIDFGGIICEVSGVPMFQFGRDNHPL